MMDITASPGPAKKRAAVALRISSFFHGGERRRQQRALDNQKFEAEVNARAAAGSVGRAGGLTKSTEFMSPAKQQQVVAGAQGGPIVIQYKSPKPKGLDSPALCAPLDQRVRAVTHI